MTYLKDFPFFQFESINNTLKLNTGLEAEILRTLSEALNFTYTLIDCQGMWGSLLQNMSWTGMIGKLDTKVY